MEVHWVRGGCVSQSAGQVIELNTICFQSPQSPSTLGKRGVGGKSPSNFLLVIKMDAVYFSWHSNYMDVCHQLFVLTRSVLSAAVPPLSLTPLAHKSGRDWLEGSLLGSLPGELRAAARRPQPADVPRVGPRRGWRLGRSCPLSFHVVFTPLLSPFSDRFPPDMASQIPLFSPTCCV